jgi:hypothetical protein
MQHVVVRVVARHIGGEAKHNLVDTLNDARYGELLVRIQGIGVPDILSQSRARFLRCWTW